MNDCHLVFEVGQENVIAFKSRWKIGIRRRLQLANISAALDIRSIIIKKALVTAGFEMGRNHEGLMNNDRFCTNPLEKIG